LNRAAAIFKPRRHDAQASTSRVRALCTRTAISLCSEKEKQKKEKSLKREGDEQETDEEEM
jgi:hypothetical protein